jgi:hypothetical protein
VLCSALPRGPSRPAMPIAAGSCSRSVKARVPSASLDAERFACRANENVPRREPQRARQMAKPGSLTSPAPRLHRYVSPRPAVAASARPVPFAFAPTRSVTAPRDSKRAARTRRGATVALCLPWPIPALPVATRTVTAFPTKDVTALNPSHAARPRLANASRVKANALAVRSGPVWARSCQERAIARLHWTPTAMAAGMIKSIPRASASQARSRLVTPIPAGMAPASAEPATERVSERRGTQRAHGVRAGTRLRLAVGIVAPTWITTAMERPTTF